MIGIKGSKDSGRSTAVSGVGKAPTVMSGFRVSRDTGTRTKKAGIGTATTAMSIGRGPRAGSGPAIGDSAIRIAADLPAFKRGARAQWPAAFWAVIHASLNNAEARM